MFRKILTNREGTALLVAMLVMGVLIAVSLVLSSLVLREILVTAGVLDGGRAYYAAESGIEVALYHLNNELPGWETEGKMYVPVQLDDDYRVVGEYRVDNTCTAYPCFDEGFDKESIESLDLTKFYSELGLNESITVPLFVVKEVGGVKTQVKVDHFTVEFYANINPREDFVFSENVESQLAGWDVLRWKIYGFNNDTKRTESISDFTALSMVNLSDEEESFNTNAKSPSWFGSIKCELGDTERYTDEILCNSYVLGGVGKIEKIKVEGQEADVFAGVCPTTEAREYYKYGADGNLDAEDIQKCYPLKSFIDEHDYNYLTLTNLMNPAVFNKDKFNNDQRLGKKSTIYYRVEFFGKVADNGEISGNETVREFADITANGYSGKSKQSISVKMQRGSFMPVFNFSLYSTYNSGE